MVSLDIETRYQHEQMDQTPVSDQYHVEAIILRDCGSHYTHPNTPLSVSYLELILQIHDGNSSL